jgi:hypothetical protein
VGHSAQTRAIPVDLAGLGVEGGFLAGFFFEFLGGFQGAFSEGELLCCWGFGIGFGGG